VLGDQTLNRAYLAEVPIGQEQTESTVAFVIDRDRVTARPAECSEICELTRSAPLLALYHYGIPALVERPDAEAFQAHERTVASFDGHDVAAMPQIPSGEAVSASRVKDGEGDSADLVG
jgi:hypothetical protein